MRCLWFAIWILHACDTFEKDIYGRYQRDEVELRRTAMARWDYQKCMKGPNLVYVMKGHIRTLTSIAPSLRKFLDATAGDCWLIVGVFLSTVQDPQSNLSPKKQYGVNNSLTEVEALAQAASDQLGNKIDYAIIKRGGKYARKWKGYTVHNHLAWSLFRCSFAHHKFSRQPEFVISTRPDLAYPPMVKAMDLGDVALHFQRHPHSIIGQQASSDNFFITTGNTFHYGIWLPLDVGLQTSNQSLMMWGYENFWQRGYKHLSDDFLTERRDCICLAGPPCSPETLTCRLEQFGDTMMHGIIRFGKRIDDRKNFPGVDRFGQTRVVNGTWFPTTDMNRLSGLPPTSIPIGHCSWIHLEYILPDSGFWKCSYGGPPKGALAKAMAKAKAFFKRAAR